MSETTPPGPENNMETASPESPNTQKTIDEYRVEIEAAEHGNHPETLRTIKREMINGGLITVELIKGPDGLPVVKVESPTGNNYARQAYIDAEYFSQRIDREEADTEEQERFDRKKNKTAEEIANGPIKTADKMPDFDDFEAGTAGAYGISIYDSFKNANTPQDREFVASYWQNPVEDGEGKPGYIVKSDATGKWEVDPRVANDLGKRTTAEIILQYVNGQVDLSAKKADEAAKPQFMPVDGVRLVQDIGINNEKLQLADSAIVMDDIKRRKGTEDTTPNERIIRSLESDIGSDQAEAQLHNASYEIEGGLLDTIKRAGYEKISDAERASRTIEARRKLAEADSYVEWLKQKTENLERNAEGALDEKNIPEAGKEPVRINILDKASRSTKEQREVLDAWLSQRFDLSMTPVWQQRFKEQGVDTQKLYYQSNSNPHVKLQLTRRFDVTGHEIRSERALIVSSDTTAHPDAEQIKVNELNTVSGLNFPDKSTREMEAILKSDEYKHMGDGALNALWRMRHTSLAESAKKYRRDIDRRRKKGISDTFPDKHIYIS